MPDISMCPSETCTVRTSCYRNKASGTKPDEFRQAYFVEAPGVDENCPHYWVRSPTRKPEPSSP